MKKHIYITLLAYMTIWSALAQVHYDKGRLTIDQTQLLQDYNDSLVYYYVPRYPRLAINQDGDYELLCIKYVGEQEENSGGLFHALFEFRMEDEDLKKLEKKLGSRVKGARIEGPIRLLETMKEGEPALGSFRIISSVLSDTLSSNPFTQNLITSGRAPFTAGSKAALAAKLNPEGSTLLWETFNGPTSDVSVAVSGYYEAIAKAYNVVVTAEMDQVYEHFSEVSKTETLFTHDEVSKAIDSLYTNGTIKIEALDRTRGLGVKSELKNILQIVTDKLINLMFDTETGWSALPEKEEPIGAVDKTGTKVLSGFAFGPASMFIPDIQHIVKERKDIKARRFRLDLSESTSIRVPFNTAGNLGGIHERFQSDPKYFRVIDLASSDYEKSEVIFQLDGDFVESFDHLVNFVTVNFRKTYGDDRDDFTRQLYFNAEDIAKGKFYKSVAFPRLGIASDDWQEYEYQISWSIRGEATSTGKSDVWHKAREKAVVISPPFKKAEIAIDFDKQLFEQHNIVSVAVDFAAEFLGETRMVKSVILRAKDDESGNVAAVFHDYGGKVRYRTVWYAQNGEKIKLPHQPMDHGYLFLTPPIENLRED